MAACKAVVFDMAGTTVDENNLVYKTLQTSIVEHGVDVSLADVLKDGGGKEKYQAVRDILAAHGVNDDKKAKEIFGDFKKRLEKAYETHTVSAFDGVEDTFRILRDHGIKVVLNTGYDSKTSNTLLRKLNWSIPDNIDLHVNADDVKNGRPAPDMIQLIAQKLGIEPKYIAKVGDSTVDIEEGHNAGCGWSIGITTGAHTVEQLRASSPDYIIDSMSQLPDIVL